jgi:hypothetical protein
MKIVLFQNYFTFSDNIYQPPKDIDMGSLIWSIIAEIFLQYFEDRFKNHLLETRNIIFYALYVDDILIVYDQSTIDSCHFTSNLNYIHTDISFKPTYQTNKQISSLDLLLLRNDSAIEIDIYRKPTTTDKTVNLLSNHHMEHKTTVYNYLLNRLHSLSLSPVRKQEVWHTIQHMAKVNGFPHTLIHNLNLQI